MMRFSRFLFFGAAMMVSCRPVPSNVTAVLQLSGSNRPELQQVITHYKQSGNDDKLRAAYYLIGNMGDKFSYDGDAVKNFDPIFNIVDSLRKKKVTLMIESPILHTKWDSLVLISGSPRVADADSIKDYSVIKSKFLIENIDQAYDNWKTAKWGDSINFDQFCEYLLPYRMGTERLEPWQKYLNNKYKPFRDTAHYKNSFELAVAINKRLRKEIALNHIIDKYPFHMSARQMELARLGACKHLVLYEAMVMRANGLPVSIELAPLWGDLNRGHEWLSLLLPGGKRYAFNAAQDKFSMIAPYRFAKVFRYSFAALHKDITHSEDIPSELLDDHLLDVTQEYTTTHDIEVPIKYNSSHPHGHAIICTFDKKWKAQDWGTISGQRAQFKNMGGNLVYNVMYYQNEKLLPASDPFIVDRLGKLHFFQRGPKEDLLLLRKFPDSELNNVNAKVMLDGRLQGANKPDFSDATDLFQIKSIPLKYETVMVQCKQRFRYVRYLSAAKHKTNLAELEFYGLSGKDTIKLTGAVKGYPEIPADQGTPYQNAFDGKPETYFSGMKDSISWAGLDLGKPRQIVKIRYCPRSDTNFILTGDTYELFVWQRDRWVSLGKQLATGPAITFRQVPSYELYLLHNLNRGKEERIFTYQQGKQIWW